MGSRDKVQHTLTVSPEERGSTKGERRGVVDESAAATLPDVRTSDATSLRVATAASARSDVGTDATIDAGVIHASALVKGNSKDAATLSIPGDGGGPLHVEMGLVAEEGKPIPSRLSSLPRSLADRFESLHFLGEGGMGAVYRATDRRLGREVALKFLYGGGAETNERLLREARSQARLEHENACKVYEAGVADGHRYIVMQYIDGKPLDEAAPGMTLEEKVRVIRQIAAALHEAHRLGLVHRDIKPSNIMVEQGEDGAFKPYLMDFGLARDVGERGQTVTGSIAGTPAFMAPEQAVGDVRSLDRRTDVYSLGATLYDIVGGRPPFIDENIFRLLQRVAREEPAALRKALPGVPEDIDAIVMKCLEKEPGRRYDSARALGEELQRYLDGEAVEARRASLGYVALKKIRRHKGKVALVGLLLAAASVVVIAWARDRQIASRRAMIAAELGEDVKEMELFLRNAYSLPLHDIEREKDIVRARLKGVEARMAALGVVGEGPGNYAIGRGLLALREPERALEHLRRAEAAGYAPAELDYAMGLALGELYKKALEATKRIENSEQKKARVAAIEASFKEPALRHLRAALGARIEVPAYVEGLIALYEGKNDEALVKAKEAFAKAPWLPDAKKLEGDAHFAEGSRFRLDAAFDYDRMMSHFRSADAAYQSASDIARSDPEVHVAECDLWIQVMNASQANPGSLRSSFERAKSACDRGSDASSRSGAARLSKAFAYAGLAWQVLEMPPGSEEPERIIGEAISRAEEAVRFSPDDPMASYLLGAAFRTQWLLSINRGTDPSAPIERAIAAYEEAIRLDPTFLWAYNELCSTYGAKVRAQGFQGVDPSASFREAIERCDRAVRLDPEFTFSYINKAIASNYMALHLIDTGRSPDATLSDALGAIRAAKARNPGFAGASANAGWIYVLRASYESVTGGDPSESLRLAEESTRDLEKSAPSSIMVYELRAMTGSAKALHSLRQGSDPAPALDEARVAAQRIVSEAKWDIDYRILRARIEILGARWALLRGADLPGDLDGEMTQIAAMLEKERVQPRLYQTLAEIHEVRAAWLEGRKRDAGEDVKKGLEMADKALAKNPRMASAFAVKSALLLLEARAKREPKAAREVAQRAKEAMDAAVREDPLIVRDVRPTQEAIEGLLAGN